MKGLVEDVDQRFRDEAAEGSRGNRKVGYEPKAVGVNVGTKVGGKPLGQGRDFLRGQAVEEEVCGDQIVCSVGAGLPVTEIGRFVGKSAPIGSGRSFERTEHPGTDVDSVDRNPSVRAEQGAGKTPVPVAQDKRAAAVLELRQVMDAGLLEDGAEGEVFEPAVGTSQAVEIGAGCRHRQK